MNENVMTLCAQLVVWHGATPQSVSLPLTPASGTLTPIDGIEKVCATPLPTLESLTEKLLLAPQDDGDALAHELSVAVSPMVPVTWPSCWLRRGLPESYW